MEHWQWTPSSWECHTVEAFSLTRSKYTALIKSMLPILKILYITGKKIFCKYCSKAEPKFGLHQDRRKHLSSKKRCHKWTFAIKIRHNLVTVMETPNFIQSPPPSGMKGTSCHIGLAQPCWKYPDWEKRIQEIMQGQSQQTNTIEKKFNWMNEVRIEEANLIPSNDPIKLLALHIFRF